MPLTKQKNKRPALIAHVIYRLDVGGLENGLVNIINRLPKGEFRHAIICLTDYTDFSQRIEPDVELIALHKKPGNDPGLYWRLFKIFRRLKPDVVHTRNLATLEAHVPAWLARIQYRIHGLHGWDIQDMGGENLRYQKLYRLINPLIHRYIPLSNDLENYLIKKIGVKPAKISKICNGVDTDRFFPRAPHPNFLLCPRMLPGGEKGELLEVPPERENAQNNPHSPLENAQNNPHSLLENAQNNPLSLWERARVREKPSAENWADDSHTIIGTVGRLEPVKDQVNLVRAFIDLIAYAPSLKDRIRLILVGDGSLRVEIEQMINQAGVAEMIWLAGSQENIPELMREMDLFVLPSKAEGISNTILEAMASGLPVVATDVGGNSQLVEEGVTGALVPKEDSTAIAKALFRYFEQPELITTQSKASRQRAVENFSLDQMVKEYQKVYQNS